MTAESTVRLEVVLPAAAEERLVAELWGEGTLGVEVRPAKSPGGDPSALDGPHADSATTGAAAAWPAPRGGGETGEPVDSACRLVALAYFAGAGWPARRRRVEALVAAAGAELVAVEPVAPRDWLAEYRRGARPISVGRRLVVDPSGSPQPPPAPPGVETLRIPAETAFGTGSHESTRLAVELLERQPLTGRRVLDVGTGSGILALAAWRFGAARVVGLDLDPAALPVAARNARRNRCRVTLFAGRAGALGPAASFDLAVVNVLPERIAADLGAIGRALAAEAPAIFSGIDTAHEAPSVARIERAGFALRGRRRAGEWVAFETVWRGAGGAR